jgi:hypothetical protein
MDFSLLKTTTTQSGTFLYNFAHNAIDGVTNYAIDTCGCCSVATRSLWQGTWWQIDIGKEYLNDALSIFGRDDSEYKRIFDRDPSEYIQSKSDGLH